MPIPPTAGPSFLTMPSSQNPAAMPNPVAMSNPNAMQQAFIAQNNLMHAQAAIAKASGTVPVSIMQLGARGQPPTTLFGQPAIPIRPVPRVADPTASDTLKDDDFEWCEYFNPEGKLRLYLQLLFYQF
jgi:hypothetical protein